MQRPESFGTREYLTEEEIRQARTRRAEFRAEADAAEAELVVDPEAPPAGASSTGGYNNFWYERASIGENTRTSLIVYPTDGRIPARVEGAEVHTATLGPDYEWTLEDPSTFTDRITATMPMTKVAGQLYEYGCHEGNYGMMNLLRGERMAEIRATAESDAN